MPAGIQLREMTSADLPAAREMLAQLGYEITPEELVRRFDFVTRDPSHFTFVATDDTSRPIGMLHVFSRMALEKPPEVVIQAIVVDRASRGTGVGKHLMTAAEDWARDRGYSTISLNSQVSRTDAHAFFSGIGYQRIAVSALLRKSL